MRAARTSVFGVAAVLAFLLGSLELSAQIQRPIFEEWVVLVMDGKPCGFGSTITTEMDRSGGAQYLTVAVQEFVVKRLNASVKITETSKIVEDADGGVLKFEEATSTFGSKIESSGVREGDDLVVSSRGQTQRYHVPRLDALGPEKIRQLCNALPLTPGQPFSFSTFAVEYPQAPVVEKGSVVRQENRDVRGTERKLWKITSEVSILPGVTSTTWVDDQNKNVETQTSIPGIGDLHEYVTTRAECMKEPEGAEIFTQTLIRPQRAIPKPKELAQATYRLTVTDPGKKIILWDQGEQRVVTSGLGTCEVSVTASTLEPNDVTWQLPHADSPELHPYLQASSYLESDSPEIQALAKRAVGDEANPVLAARKIQDFVSGYITKKDMSVGFASAAETAKSREGDCTEHAVLCAALGRAVGLPTRVVVGLGYIPPGMDEPALADKVDTTTGFFGGHMWAEAWVGPDQWVPMDAALNGFDVGHIAVTKTALAEINPLVDLQVPLLQLLDNLKIEVVKTTAKAGLAVAPLKKEKPTSHASPKTGSAPPAAVVHPQAKPSVD